ncbi:hypothetical protein CHUAL_005733 [Chamberlinius hualienensis]
MEIKKSASVESFNRNPRSRALTGYEKDVHNFAAFLGVVIDPVIFRILLDLLRLGVSADGIIDVLNCIRRQTAKLKRASVPTLKDNSPKS